MAVESRSMELKKVQQQAQAPSKSTVNTLGSVRDFIGDVKSEIQRITWTSPEELKSYTKIVVGATFAFGFGIYIVDLVIQAIMFSSSNIVRFLFG